MDIFQLSTGEPILHLDGYTYDIKEIKPDPSKLILTWKCCLYSCGAIIVTSWNDILSCKPQHTHVKGLNGHKRRMTMENMIDFMVREESLIVGSGNSSDASSVSIDSDYLSGLQLPRSVIELQNNLEISSGNLEHSDSAELSRNLERPDNVESPSNPDSPLDPDFSNILEHSINAELSGNVDFPRNFHPPSNVAYSSNIMSNDDTSNFVQFNIVESSSNFESSDNVDFHTNLSNQGQFPMNPGSSNNVQSFDNTGPRSPRQFNYLRDQFIETMNEFANNYVFLPNNQQPDPENVSLFANYMNQLIAFDSATDNN